MLQAKASRKAGRWGLHGQGWLWAVLSSCLAAAAPGAERLSLFAFFKRPCVCSLPSAALECWRRAAGAALLLSVVAVASLGVLSGAWMRSCSSGSCRSACLFPDQEILGYIFYYH